MKKIGSRMQSVDLFLIVSLGITGLCFLLNIRNHGGYFMCSVMDAESSFSDFFYHIAGSSDPAHMYMTDSRFCFPPLAYCMYWLLWRIHPYEDPESILNWMNFKNADNAMLVLIIYDILFAFLLVYCITEYYKETGAKYILLLPTAIIVSYPFFCTSLQRGNSVALVAVVIALAWLWMDAESPAKQEAAMILIAVAAAFKFYPAIMGLIYIRRRDWKRTVRLLIYGVLFVFLPFVFFGGIRGLLALADNLTSLSMIRTTQYGTIRGMTLYLLKRYLQMDPAAALPIGIGMETVFLVCSVVCILLSRKRWQSVLFVSGILVSYIASGYIYNSVYYLPVLLMFLKDHPGCIGSCSFREQCWRGVNILLLGLIFCIPCFWIYVFHGQLNEGTSVMMYLLLGINTLDVLYSFGKRRKAGVYADEG